MKTFLLHWFGTYTETVYGDDIADAMNKAGIGNGALPALDYWEEIENGQDVNEENELL